MRKALPALLILGMLGCERKQPAPAPANPAPVPSTTPSPAKPAAVGDPAPGDSIDDVFAKWGKPDAFKLNIGGEAQIFAFIEMPAGINPDAEMTYYFLKNSQAVVFRYDGRAMKVTQVMPTPEGEKDLIPLIAARNNQPQQPAPASVPAAPGQPEPPKPGGGP
jgi:hypothetical protein